MTTATMTRYENSFQLVQSGPSGAMQVTLRVPIVNNSTGWFKSKHLDAALGLVRTSVIGQLQDGTFGNSSFSSFRADPDAPGAVGATIQVVKHTSSYYMLPSLSAAVENVGTGRAPNALQTSRFALVVTLDAPPQPSSPASIDDGSATTTAAAPATAAPADDGVSSGVEDRVGANLSGKDINATSGEEGKIPKRKTARGSKRTPLAAAAAAAAAAVSSTAVAVAGVKRAHPDSVDEGDVASRSLSETTSSSFAVDPGSITEMPVVELRARLGRTIEDLWGIFKGKVPSERHQLYRARGNSRRNLKYSVCLGNLTEAQQEIIVEDLFVIFCKNGKKQKYTNYVMDVLLPEAVVRIYAEYLNTDLESTRDIIANLWRK